ncbi:MAG: hypothetical protein HKM24_06965 [Gammaproteobacteria bacterium]|nr:hypothetical protein [Gammaproteobacteria bacterium]
MINTHWSLAIKTHFLFLFALVAGFTTLLLSNAKADGLGGLSALGTYYLLMFLVIGIVPLIGLIVAFVLKARQSSSAPVIIVLLIPAMLYAPTAFMFFFANGFGVLAKSAGTVGALMLMALVWIFTMPPSRNRRALIAALVLATVVLWIVPNAYWKGPSFGMVKNTFIDNHPSGVLIKFEPSLYDSHLFRLSDGRRIVKEHEYREFYRPMTYGDAGFATIESFDSERSGTWYKITMYGETKAYTYGSPPYWHRPKLYLPIIHRKHNKYAINTEWLGVLLDENADVDYRDKLRLLLHGLEDPYKYASESDLRRLKNKYQWAEELIQRGQVDVTDPSFVSSVAPYAKTAGFRFLLDHGVGVNTIDDNGMSLLHWAVKRYNLVLAEQLIKQGANSQVRNSEGHTPLDLARGQYKTQSLERLEQIFRAAHP